MRIDRLHLKNYRNFEDAEFRLNPHFTVVIGKNGKGKSTIIKALSVCGSRLVSELFSALPDSYKKFSFRQIVPSDFDVRRYSDGGTSTAKANSLSVKFDVCYDNAKTENVTIQFPSSKRLNAHLSSNIKEAKDNYKNYLLRSDESLKIPVPILLVFGVSRLAGSQNNKEYDKTIYTDKHNALKNGYLNWYKLEAKQYGYRKWLQDFYRNESQDNIDRNRKLFFKAIRDSIPYIDLVDYREGTKTQIASLVLSCTIDNTEYPELEVDMLSDGMKVMVEMVAEIAYRCIVLNGHLGENAISMSHGLVMIDELDMHLHPNWQQHVVSDLKRAFPNIQFVATTHSPIIVQSLAADELINLDEMENPLTEEPKNMGLEEVAVEIMNTKASRSEAYEKKYADAVDTFTLLLKSGKTLTQDDYRKLRDIMAGAVESDTNDPVFKAYLKVTTENETH